MPVFLLHSMKLLFTKPIPPNPAPSKIIPIISETLYIYLIGFHNIYLDNFHEEYIADSFADFVRRLTADE